MFPPMKLCHSMTCVHAVLSEMLPPEAKACENMSDPIGFPRPSAPGDQRDECEAVEVRQHRIVEVL